MTNILKPENPNPNIILTYNNITHKKPDFMNAVFKSYEREGV